MSTRPDFRRTQNNFDLLRLILAIGVCFHHVAYLIQSTVLPKQLPFLSAQDCVFCFFTISGYLIAKSLNRSQNLWDYAEKRVRRIYPAYFLVITACVVAGFFLTNLSAGEFARSAHTWKYIVFNLSFLNMLTPDLPGVFTDNRSTAINGSLWSIRVEVFCYVLLPVMLFFARKWGTRATAILGLLLFCFGIAVVSHLEATMNQPILKQIRIGVFVSTAYFLAGVMISKRSDWFRIHGNLLAASSLVLLIASALLSSELWLYGKIIPASILTIYAATAFPYLGNWSRHGDLSYGIYIFHFPITQTLIQLGWDERLGDWSFLAIVMLLTALLAKLSWSVVEKPFLKRSSHYRIAEASEPRESLPEQSVSTT